MKATTLKCGVIGVFGPIKFSFTNSSVVILVYSFQISVYIIIFFVSSLLTSN